MAKYKHGKNAKYAENVVDDDDDAPVYARKVCETTKEIDQPIHASTFPLDKKPFSAINADLVPAFIDDPKEYFDEFGFRKKDESPCSSEEANDIEDSAHRMRFIAAVEHAHSNVKDELVWSKVDVDSLRCDKVEQLVKAGGIPHSMRPYLWPRFAGATKKRIAAGYSYDEVLRQSAQDKPSIGVQIERSLLRTLPNNICFWKKNGSGVDALRRVLKAVAFIYPDLGYCEGMGIIVAMLLLFCSEETTFWMMTALIEDILPPNYYSQTLLGVQADERATRHLMKSHVPDLNKILDELDVEVSLVTVIISIMKMKEDEIVELGRSSRSSADLFNAISQLPQSAILMADQGMIVNTTTDTNLPKQKVQRRKLARSKSIIQQIFHSKDGDNDPKLKNVRQTEILVDLKDSVLQICRYFISCDEKMEMNISTKADYSPESHAHDIDNFLAGRREGHKRARALLDFARQDEDELGFRKNDIITIICEKDEHCWVGEVNGLRGWFPAKFVEVVDERGKNYTVYGDEAVSPEITEYIRGRLANSFRQVMDHGIMESVLYPSTAYHPWSFIVCQLLVLSLAEDIAYYSVEKHFNSVYSRLTLCNTFKLDQDGKILTPEELLFRSVQLINDSHNAANAHPDVKLRLVQSLLVLGVNEQCLHLWFDLFCSSEHQEAIRSKYYHPWAFIRTPAWRQIKCDLRLLSQFSFNLNVDFEIEGVEKKKKKATSGMMTSAKKKMMSTVMAGELKPNGDEPLKKGVTDIQFCGPASSCGDADHHEDPCDEDQRGTEKGMLVWGEIQTQIEDNIQTSTDI
ncbi:RUN domain protein [Ancylostoma ceylanicum]|uniref:RUN and TBC1 domain-containing protein 3 n=1 Tax=Ancylostoma ceylanicum TaxID=53326 RepID=A0A0D6M2N2_9BILA|nr:RUN domain protein [Ancylostoma ceylanicum]